MEIGIEDLINALKAVQKEYKSDKIAVCDTAIIYPGSPITVVWYDTVTNTVNLQIDTRNRRKDESNMSTI